MSGCFFVRREEESPAVKGKKGTYGLKSLSLYAGKEGKKTMKNRNLPQGFDKFWKAWQI
ncbi:hypothetical protein [Lacrimispora sp.]|uniref:hypothetical protein n=1 Tax=Lacrimispora sp. TaxID=2719234 RepID=UPI0039E5A070